MTALGRRDGPVLVVDLTGHQTSTWTALWDALAEPCGLPLWCGRNLHARWDTIQTGAISEVLDAHSELVVRLCADGFFDNGDEGRPFIDVTNERDYQRVMTSTS